MICPNCATPNEDGTRFCVECGTALQASCPVCGANIKPGAKFCGECGAQLAGGAATAPVAAAAPAASSAPTPSAATAERRLVSVLFADLVGFTPFAEERDAEEVRDTLSRYFALASDVIARYGGTVEKFIGDAVMAVWGAPTAHEDDAERAVRAALELTDAVRGLGAGIQARAGVLTGEAAVTIGATNQGMVAGDLVNTASRLQSVAPAGNVLVGEATQRAASRAIAFAPAGEQLLKGKQAPVAAWQALRIIAEVGGRNRSDALEAPFVGRDEELRLLKDLFHATAREKRVRLVSVMGPGGIGKSRLAWEFSKYIDGLVEDIWWHAGRSPSYGEGITFWALGEMVRGRCGLVETDDEAKTRAKVSEAIARWVPDPDERGWIERSLLTLLGVESGMGAEQLFGAWRTFFERIAAHGPTVLVFEDTHFADSGLLDFIDHLIDWSRDLPIYVVTLARPDLVERRPGWGAGKRNFVSLYLEPLPEAQMRELLAGLVPGLPEMAAKAIVARADGIPLYAVETVRMLVGEGRLAEQEGVYVPQGDLQALAVPETLTALIASRLDSLDERDRRVIQDAAVLGQSFSLAALAEVSEISRDELEERIVGLVRREVLRRETDARSPEHGQFAFVQALIREVAYNTLAKRDRKTRHLAAARHFESLDSDEIAGALASHYLAAHANAGEGEEADALATQARIALKAAAQRASGLGAYEQTVNFVQQALTVSTDQRERAELLEQAGMAAATAANFQQAEGMLREAAELWREAGDRAALARTTASLARALSVQYKADEARTLLEAAAAAFGDLAEDPVAAALNLAQARFYLIAGDLRQSLEHADQVIEVAERYDLLPILINALIIKGTTLGSIGRRREGIALLDGARALAHDHGLVEDEIRALTNTAQLKLESNLMASLEATRDARALARRFGQRTFVLQAASNTGYLGFLAGDWDDAVVALEEALSEELGQTQRMDLLSNWLIIRASRGISIAEELTEMESIGAGLSDPAWRLTLLDPQANAALAEGRFDEASTAWQAMAGFDASVAPEFLYRAGRAALWKRDTAAARELLASVEATGVHGSVIEARIATLQAGIAALEDRVPDALALYREALRGWQEVRAAWDEALTGLDMVLLLDSADGLVAEAAWAARHFFERVGARPYLARLGDAAESGGATSTTAGTVHESGEASANAVPLPAPPAP